MRIVSSTDLSPEQDAIYLDAPLKGVILIIGPPGSGKTIMAFLRAEALLNTKLKSVNVIMYNNVLKAFSKNNIKNKSLNVTTMNSWVWSWWMRFSYGKKPPQKEKYDNDWYEMFNQLADRKSKNKLNLNRVNWQHLIIDEGQDFKKEMYEFLDMTRSIIFNDIEAPSLTILADENQRINENSSTINDIKKTLRIDSKNIFSLTKNYRNTDEINALITNFYVGSETGTTKPSGRKGEKVKLVNTSNFENTINYILRYIKAHENEEILIIVQQDELRIKYFEALNNKLDSDFFYVQTYTSKPKDEWNNTGRLQFDIPGTVSIFNKESCKGLEFDTVFIPELHSVNVESDNIEGFMMDMYVMCSRARNLLVLMLQPSSQIELPIMKYLPKDDENIMEYINA